MHGNKSYGTRIVDVELTKQRWHVDNFTLKFK